MSFVELQEAHRQLRLKLRVLVGENALPEVTVKVPTREYDELSFVRLVVWSYVLVQETGRVALRFLKELPPFAATDGLPEVTYLRTWATHNLAPEKDSDQKKLLQAWAWLKEACGTSSPADDATWGACFGRLCGSVTALVKKAIVASELLESPTDGPRLKDEFLRRLDRNWDGYRFDAFVADAGSRLGFAVVDPVAFRGRHLDAWRRVVATADEPAIQRLLEQRIEKDLLDLMNEALPLTAREFVQGTGVTDAMELAALMLAVRARPRVLATTLGEILSQIAGAPPSPDAAPVQSEISPQSDQPMEPALGAEHGRHSESEAPET